MKKNNHDELKALRRELPEPGEAKNPWPYAVWLFFGIMIGWGATYLSLEIESFEALAGDQRTLVGGAASETFTEDEVAVDGGLIYSNACMACHQATGQGIPGAFPPLAGSEWVIGSSEIVAKILLKGLSGPITVKGLEYNGVMPAFEEQLSDQEIAAVVQYIQKEWGNNRDSTLTAQGIGELREKFKSRTQSWTADELKK